MRRVEFPDSFHGEVKRDSDSLFIVTNNSKLQKISGITEIDGMDVS